jgi:hypothetical protein
MSGRPIYVCGLRVDFHTVTVTDPHICSVFYEVASHISNFDVRFALQGVLGLGNPSMLPPVEIQRGGDEAGYTYTISNEHLTVYIPISSDHIDPIPVVVDSAICLTIGLWSGTLSDQQLRASVRAAANLGFQATAHRLALGFANGS